MRLLVFLSCLQPNFAQWNWFGPPPPGGPGPGFGGPPPMGMGGGMGGLLQNLGGLVQDVAMRVNNGQGMDVMNDFKGLLNGPPPEERMWQQQARRFCRRYPGHPKCRGQLPQFGDIGGILTQIVQDSGNWLPRVPLINIRDPLAGINRELLQALEGFSHRFGDLGSNIMNTLKGVCNRHNCLEQSKETQTMKSTVLEKIVNFEKQHLGRDNTDNVHLRMDRTLQLKQALLEKANLKGVVAPADNGVFEKDLLLTEQQSNFMLNELGKGGVGANPVPGKARRASIFFEENPVQKWPNAQAIPYTFHTSLDNLDKNDVTSAIKEIEKNTCIRFSFQANPSGNHINYQKIDSQAFCGLSYVGRVNPANPVYLSFQCGNGKGIAIHETMHALGVGHQHLRMDRDKHIKMDWSNVNPQHYDAFVVLDSKLYSTYGIPYAYDSIMHYNAYTAAVNIAKPTMIPLVNEQANIGQLGQRAKMANQDIELLNKMYCKPGCDDKNVYCGAWALQNLCTNPSHNVFMGNNCKKSCNLCK